VSLDDLLVPPGRYTRPPKMVIIMRGLPGAGKTYVAKMIKDKETGEGGDAPRVMALDDYFEADGEYEYDEDLEDSYRDCLFKSFKKNIDGRLFTFLIVDAINNKLDHFKPMWSHAKTNGFEVYVCEVKEDKEICINRNIHNKTAQEVEALSKDWDKVPDHMNQIMLKTEQDSSQQKQNETSEVSKKSAETSERSEETSCISEASSASAKQHEEEQEIDESSFLKASKWEILDREEKMARLDGTTMKRRKGMHESSGTKLESIEDWLEIGDKYYKKDDGKKRVRWADLEMRKEQAKVKEMGFVLGKKMYSDSSEAERDAQSMLTATKIIPNRFQSEFHNP